MAKTYGSECPIFRWQSKSVPHLHADGHEARSVSAITRRKTNLDLDQIPQAHSLPYQDHDNPMAFVIAEHNNLINNIFILTTIT